MTSRNEALIAEVRSGAFDSGILNMGISMDWVKPKPTYEELEKSLEALQAQFMMLATNSITTMLALTDERDMLARKVQELTTPAPSPAFERLGHEITVAISVMDELRRNRR